MRNLYYVHSQYTLILALAIAKGNYPDDENILICSGDFKYDASYVRRVSKQFDRSLVFEGSYYITKGDRDRIEKVRWVVKELFKIRRFLGNDLFYDRYFSIWTNNWHQLYVLKKLHKKNACLDVLWIEDGAGAYYTPKTIGEIGFAKNKWGRYLRKIIGKIFVGKYYSINEQYAKLDLGSNTWIKSYYLTFPEYLKIKVRGIKCYEINHKSIVDSVKCIYKKIDLPFWKESIFLPVDNTQSGFDVKLFGEICSHICKFARARGMMVFYKYHPREEKKIPQLESDEYAIEINRNLAAESVFSTNLDNDLIVIGNLSTSLMISRIFGFATFSITKLIDKNYNEDVVSFYEKIGVTFISSEYDKSFIS